jgi:hypothetical protein
LFGLLANIYPMHPEAAARTTVAMLARDAACPRINMAGA